MPYNAVIVTIILFVAVLMNHGFSEDKIPVELKISVFPQNVAIGDTCYVLVTAINHSDEDAYVFPVRVSPVTPREARYDDMVQFDLSRHEKTWRGAVESADFTLATIDRPGFRSTIPSGRAIIFLAVPFQFPPIENWHQDDFWRDVQKELTNNPEGLSFDFRVEFCGPWILKEKVVVRGERTSLADRITITLRNDKEMKLIEQWYHNTPKKIFPFVVEDKYLYKIRPPDRRDGIKILGHSPWQFITLGNRYPSDPNAPETWQEWKQLEESITPSTMRDEIRLTRILIQYCDTKDEKVLEELKEWFDSMNEIQRTVMAKNIGDLAEKAHISGRVDTLLPLFRDIYRAIRKYDIAARTMVSRTRMNAGGLFE